MWENFKFCAKFYTWRVIELNASNCIQLWVYACWCKLACIFGVLYNKLTFSCEYDSWLFFISAKSQFCRKRRLLFQYFQPPGKSQVAMFPQDNWYGPPSRSLVPLVLEWGLLLRTLCKMCWLQKKCCKYLFNFFFLFYLSFVKVSYYFSY